jgi:AcrR family transcriptional regulator
MSNEKTLSFQEEKVIEIKRSIIRAALVCIGRYGYQGVKLTHIAEEARCSRELPRYHFKSKEGLVYACLQEINRIWSDVFEGVDLEKLTAKGFIDQVVDSIITWYESDPEVYLGLSVLIFGAADPSNITLRKEIIRVQKTTRENYQRFISHYAKSHSIETHIDTDLMPKVLYAAFRGIGYNFMISPDKDEFINLLNEYKKMFLIVLEPKLQK